MSSKVFVFDPTVDDPLSKVRGVGRYIQILRENFPDWIFTNKLEIENRKLEILINPFFNFLQPPRSHKRIAQKQIAVIHDIIPLKYPEHFPAGLRGNLNIFFNQFLLRQYDLIITDSEASQKDIIDLLHIKEDKIRVICPTLPKIFLNSESKIHNSEFNSEFLNLNSKFCLYVGDATWNKNLVNIARAIKEINVTCVFVGKVFEKGKTAAVLQNSSFPPTAAVNGWQKELNNFFYETLGDKRFIFTGFLPDAELIKLYQQAKLNILLSRDEGFGFSYLEAASQGCPSVLSDISVLHEISDDKGVIFVDHKKVNEAANAIGEIYFNKDIGRVLGSEAKQRSGYFSAERFRKSFQEIL